MSNKLTLIIDGNYLFYKSMCVVEGFGDKRKRFLDNQEQINILVRKVATDFVSALSKFKGYHKVIFAKDSKSWRKSFDKNYKANRVKDDSVNWTNLYKALDDFAEIIRKRGVIISNHNDAEGDDLCYLWANLLLENEHSNNIVITGDGDLTQIVDFNENAFTAVYNNNSKQRKFIVKKGFQNWLLNKLEKESDINDLFSEESDTIGSNAFEIVADAMNNITVEEIDPMYVSLFKAICGDDGDNILSVYSWKNDKDKTKRITKSHLDKLYKIFVDRFDTVDMNQIYSNKNLQNFIRVQLQSMIKTEKINEEEFNSNLIKNITLSYLNKLVIPKNIVENFEAISADILRESFSYKTESFDRINLLADTSFGKKVNNTAAVFKVLESFS